ncbi:MAG: phosphate/phosphite/phosphonate ABC transporter substrate-binding protein [Gammaproteobacteria bacterium]|nr:MAG: phosphate/phosphite/phosphonate ABC transporter substrate-binding protein [Gammaproteobacteria bacterium]
MKRLSIAVCLLLMMSVQAVFAAEYSVGVVPQFEARRLHQIWRPILDYLQQKTGHTFKLEGSPTIPEFETEFEAGRFDFVYMNPYHLIVANREQGYRPILRDVGRELFGLLVVRIDSQIQKMQDLEGKVIAFPAPNALGASLQMRQELHDLFGLQIVPRYVKTHDSVYLNVLLGQADAGGGVQKTLNRQQPQIRKALKIIHKTRPVAPHPIAVHPRVPAEAAEKVTRALLALGETPEGAALLAKIPIKKIGRAGLQDYEILKTMKLERFYVKSR